MHGQTGYEQEAGQDRNWNFNDSMRIPANMYSMNRYITSVDFSILCKVMCKQLLSFKHPRLVHTLALR